MNEFGQKHERGLFVRMAGVVAVVGVAALLGLGITGVLTGGHSTNGAPSRAGAMRTVLVVAQGARFAPRSVGRRDCIAYPRGCVNGLGGIEVAYAVSGQASAGAETGEVLTDTNCRPDSYGISHCLNEIRLAGGRVITVRHDHSMANDPCLAPGERVRVRAALS